MTSDERYKPAASGPELGLCWGSVPAASLIELAELAASAQLRRITITAGHYARALQAGNPPAELRRRLDDLGVAVAAVDPLIGALPGIPDPATVEPALAPYLTFTERDCQEAAEGTGARTVNLAHFLGLPVPLTQLQDTVAAVGERNAALGLATTLEFIPESGVPDLATALQVCDVTPHVTVLFDTWHFGRRGGTLADLANLTPGAIGGMQLSDWSPPDPSAAYVPMMSRLDPGAGALPLPEILARIEATSPGRDLCLEVFGPALPRHAWPGAVARLAAAGRAVLEQAAAAFRRRDLTDCPAWPSG